jgi:hypothetical protein
MAGEQWPKESSPECRIGIHTGTGADVADHKQGGNEQHRGITKPGQGLFEGQNAGCGERESGTHRHDLHRQTVPDEEGHHHGQ